MFAEGAVGGADSEAVTRIETTFRNTDGSGRVLASGSAMRGRQESDLLEDARGVFWRVDDKSGKYYAMLDVPDLLPKGPLTYRGNEED